MSYCLNPACLHPQNLASVCYCLACGSYLLLRDCYRTVKPIGQGGMGRTFLAVNESYLSQPRCVIKQFCPQDYGIELYRRAFALFRQEALRLETLSKHPQIPKLLEYFEQDGYYYLVQEFIEGQNLEQELAEAGAFNEIQIRQLLNNLLPVLQFIHDRNIIHRDIKPANIIRRRSDGQLVLVDFGAAKYFTSAALAQTGRVIGSAEYVAPEQTRGKAVFASDLYSLGVTCIHLLTQIPPFDVFDSSEDAWVWRCYLCSPVSEFLGQVLDKLLQHAPKLRYQSATEAIAHLNAQSTQLPLSKINFRHRANSKFKTQNLKSIDSSLVAKPQFSVTIFEPQTQSWHRIPHFSDSSGSVWGMLIFFHPQVAMSATCNNKVMPQFTSKIVAQKRKSPWLVLESMWLATLWLSVFICLAIGLKLKHYSSYPKADQTVLSFPESVRLNEPD